MSDHALLTPDELIARYWDDTTDGDQDNEAHRASFLELFYRTYRRQQPQV
jgi:hypothetical protein